MWPPPSPRRSRRSHTSAPRCPAAAGKREPPAGAGARGHRQEIAFLWPVRESAPSTTGSADGAEEMSVGDVGRGSSACRLTGASGDSLQAGRRSTSGRDVRASRDFLWRSPASTVRTTLISPCSAPRARKMSRCARRPKRGGDLATTRWPGLPWSSARAPTPEPGSAPRLGATGRAERVRRYPRSRRTRPPVSVTRDSREAVKARPLRALCARHNLPGSGAAPKGDEPKDTVPVRSATAFGLVRPGSTLPKRPLTLGRATGARGGWLRFGSGAGPRTGPVLAISAIRRRSSGSGRSFAEADAPRRVFGPCTHEAAVRARWRGTNIRAQSR